MQTALKFESVIGWRRQIVVLLYHHLRADNDTSTPLSGMEKGVLRSVFEMQLRVFQRWYEPVDSQHVSAAVHGKVVLPADAMLVTFDDGYRDNRTLAGPVLSRRGIPGIVFLATGYVETPRKYWWVRLNDIIRHLSDETIENACQVLQQWPDIGELLANSSVADDESRRRLWVAMVQIVKTKSEEEIGALLDQLDSATHDHGESCLPILDWSEIREMAKGPFEFGAHTVTHPRLTRLPDEKVQHEMIASAQTIATQIGRYPSTFAYPYGDCNEAVEQMTERAGFYVAYAANPGVVIPGKTNPARVPRLQLYASDPAHLVGLVLILKLGKYMPRLAKMILSRSFDTVFEI